MAFGAIQAIRAAGKAPGKDIKIVSIDGTEQAVQDVVSGTMVSGDEVSMWVRATLGCRRIDGEWKIVHDHESVPFDPETGQALTSLRP